MARPLPITQNRDVVVSWVYAYSRQPNMSIHEHRIMMRVLEYCQTEALQGQRLKPFVGENAPKFDHGLFNVDVTMNVRDAIFSGLTHKDVTDALDALSSRSFTYEDDEEWWKCSFISNPVYKKRSGKITFSVGNSLWDVLTKFASGYREFELNKALALPSGYAVRFYMLISNNPKPVKMSVEEFKEWLGIPEEDYKDKKGKHRIDNLESRVIEPAQRALNESCPWTFTYSKVKENPNVKTSKVVGFMFYPVEQPQFRDQELQQKEQLAKQSPRFMLYDHVLNYLREMGFTANEIGNNKQLFEDCQKELPDIMTELAMLKARSREKNNPKGWIIASLKGKLEDQRRENR